MLKITPFKQKSGYCGPSSLKMVLDYFGIKKTEKELAKLSGCSSSIGVDANKILKAGKKLGLKGFVKDYSNIEQIRKYVNKKRVPVIVDWFSGDDGHYSVVIGIDKENIYLQDPEIGHMRAMKINKFKSVWFDYSGKYLLSKEQLNIGRMIVLYK